MDFFRLIVFFIFRFFLLDLSIIEIRRNDKGLLQDVITV